MAETNSDKLDRILALLEELLTRIPPRVPPVQVAPIPGGPERR